MEQQLDAATYYKIVDFFEEELDNITTDYENLSIPTISTPQYFTQPTPEVRIIGQQVSLLQERSSEAIAILNTLAAIDKGNNKIKLHPLLMRQMEEQVQPFIDFYFEFNKQNQTGKKDNTEDKKNDKKNKAK